MKNKWHSLLLVGLVLILASSGAACGQPMPTSPVPTKQPAIQPQIAMPGENILTTTGTNLTIRLKSDEMVKVVIGPINLTDWKEPQVRPFVSIFASITDPNGNVIKTSSSVLRPKYNEAQSTYNTSSFTFTAPMTGAYELQITKNASIYYQYGWVLERCDITAIIYP